MNKRISLASSDVGAYVIIASDKTHRIATVPHVLGKWYARNPSRVGVSTKEISPAAGWTSASNTSHTSLAMPYDNDRDSRAVGQTCGVLMSENASDNSPAAIMALARKLHEESQRQRHPIRRLTRFMRTGAINLLQFHMNALLNASD